MKKIEIIAEVCHEANRAFCRATGDNSQSAWENAPDWQRQAAVSSVKHKIENLNDFLEDQHEQWVTYEILRSWKWRPMKDANKKEHPSLVPYNKLSDNEKKKDALFCAIVSALI